SVPMAQGARRPATATPDPLLDPPGVRAVAGSHGFHGVPRYLLVPHPPNANSTKWVLPMTIMPAALALRTTVAVVWETRSSQTLDPPVVTRPSISTRSFNAIGIPCSGPTECPARIALSAASAARRASSG